MKQDFTATFLQRFIALSAVFSLLILEVVIYVMTTGPDFGSHKEILVRCLQGDYYGSRSAIGVTSYKTGCQSLAFSIFLFLGSFITGSVFLVSKRKLFLFLTIILIIISSIFFWIIPYAKQFINI